MHGSWRRGHLGDSAHLKAHRPSSRVELLRLMDPACQTTPLPWFGRGISVQIQLHSRAPPTNFPSHKNLLLLLPPSPLSNGYREPHTEGPTVPIIVVVDTLDNTGHWAAFLAISIPKTWSLAHSFGIYIEFLQ